MSLSRTQRLSTIAALLLLLLIALLYHYHSRATMVRQQFFSFGTLIDISIWTQEREKALDAIASTMQLFDRLHHMWHPKIRDNGGELSQLNRHFLQQPETAFELSATTLALLQLSKKLSTQSLGYFNPAIGKLIDLWGFNLLEQQTISRKIPPSEQAIKALLQQQLSMDDVRISHQGIYSNKAAIQLDFGAIAKGFALDLAMAHLHKQGFDNVLINAGGDIKLSGSKSGQPWQIGIRNPEIDLFATSARAQTAGENPLSNPPGNTIAAISLQGTQSIVTSGNYERYFLFQGQRYHHIINPFTGYPGKDIVSVTIVHPQAAVADAAATAVFLAAAGKGQDGQKILQRLDIALYMIIRKDQSILLSSPMHKQLQLFLPRTKYQIHVID